MFPALSSVLDFPLVLNPTSAIRCYSACPPPFVAYTINHDAGPGKAADDPTKLVKVVASHGKTGEQCDLRYGRTRGMLGACGWG